MRRLVLNELWVEPDLEPVAVDCLLLQEISKYTEWADQYPDVSFAYNSVYDISTMRNKCTVYINLPETDSDIILSHFKLTFGEPN